MRRRGRQACPERSTVGDDVTIGGRCTDVEADLLSPRCFTDTASDPVRDGDDPKPGPIADSVRHLQLAGAPAGPVIVCSEPGRNQRSTNLRIPKSVPTTDSLTELSPGKRFSSRNAGPLVSDRSEPECVDPQIGCVTSRITSRHLDAEHIHRLAFTLQVGGGVAEHVVGGNTNARPGYRDIRSLPMVVAARCRSAWRHRIGRGVGASESGPGMITWPTARHGLGRNLLAARR